MAILESAKPGVLQFLVAPERREWPHLVVQFIFTARHGGRENNVPQASNTQAPILWISRSALALLRRDFRFDRAPKDRRLMRHTLPWLV